MIIDVDATDYPGNSTYITISNPVLQRIIDGRTKGIALCALGSITASFYASENGDNYKGLYFI
ncbi:hypothetical protein JW960_04530 [candidate division KSB1 bacterium]|nr:hypothetical protein [candidate division KSB1 bacterium]